MPHQTVDVCQDAKICMHLQRPVWHVTIDARALSIGLATNDANETQLSSRRKKRHGMAQAPKVAKNLLTQHLDFCKAANQYSMNPDVSRPGS